MPSKRKQMHERDLLGSHVVDFDERVDVKRLRQDRLARLQAEMAKADLGAALLFDPVNVRYATGTRLNETFDLRFMGRHALVPREGKPILFSGNSLQAQVVGDQVQVDPIMAVDFWTTGDGFQEASRDWVKMIKATLKKLGLGSERLGVDRLDAMAFQSLVEQRIKVGDVLEALAMARAIKTPDEIVLIRQACAIADVALANIQQTIRPGITENELFAVLMYENIKRGGERIDGKLLGAGGNTNPWLKRDASDRLVVPGNLVAIDTDMAGPLGYFADISRTYMCGDVKPNEEQMDAYERAYDYIYSTIPYFRPGTTFQEIAEAAPDIPREYNLNRYAILAHGAGMSDEWPAIYFRDPRPDERPNYSGHIEENMVICMEASFGREGGREQVKLEEQLLIRANGPEIISQAPFDWRFL